MEKDPRDEDNSDNDNETAQMLFNTLSMLSVLANQRERENEEKMRMLAERLSLQAQMEMGRDPSEGSSTSSSSLGVLDLDAPDVQTTDNKKEKGKKKKELSDAKKEQITNALKELFQVETKNGDKTTTEGPCKCGYKHYLDGEEKDYVFKIGTSTGKLYLGYNLEDNPYQVAGDFIIKHKLNEHSLDDTRYRSAIANEIINHTQTHSSEKYAQSTKPEATSTFDPMKSMTTINTNHSRYNSVTGKWESIVSPLEMLALKNKEHTERKKGYLKAQLEEQKSKDAEYREKERIRNQILASRREAEERRKQELKEAEERKKKPVIEDSNLVWKSPVIESPTNSPSKDTTDSLKRPREVQQEKQEKRRLLTDSDDEDDKMEYERSQRYSSNKNALLIDSDDEDDSELKEKLQFNMLLQQARSEYAKKNVKNSPQKKFATLDSLKSTKSKSKDDDDDVPTPTKKDDWSIQLMVYKLKKLKVLGFIGALDRSGFDEDEIRNMLRLSQMLLSKGVNPTVVKRSASMDDEEWISPSTSTSTSSQSWFAGSGKSLKPQTSGFVEECAMVENTKGKEKESDGGNQMLEVDESSPVTTIVVRLHTGDRLTVKCNHTHTIADLRGHISLCSEITREYDLLITYPRKVLGDMLQTVKDAGLLNATIVQSLK